MAEISASVSSCDSFISKRYAGVFEVKCIYLCGLMFCVFSLPVLNCDEHVVFDESVKRGFTLVVCDAGASLSFCDKSSCWII